MIMSCPLHIITLQIQVYNLKSSCENYAYACESSL